MVEPNPPVDGRNDMGAEPVSGTRSVDVLFDVAKRKIDAQNSQIGTSTAKQALCLGLAAY
jgi:hypothetical protein